jgi:hypothetical protein
MPRHSIFRISVRQTLLTINSISADHKLNLTDYNSLCKQICESSDRIVGAWAFGLDNLIASYVKPRFAEPDKAEQERMFIQAQIMQSIVSSNEVMYGKVKHIIVSFEHFDAFLFPLMWGGGQKDEKTIISFGCIKPYSTEAVVSAIERIFAAGSIQRPAF